MDQLLKCQQRNPRLFVIFRVFFNSRFYYPVFSILFFDYGLTAEQFALLNLVWALSIIVFEVPSGALADQIGRKPLIVLASILMILEMAVLLVVKPDTSWVFPAFLMNRILSGFAEACASGADEALTYDSLPVENREQRWAEILSSLMKYSAIGFLVASIVGGLVYDPNLIQKVLSFFSYSTELTVKQTVKLPIFLTLLGGIVCLITALRLIEAPHTKSDDSLWVLVKKSFLSVAETGKWITQTRVMWLLLLLGIILDSSVRLFLTLSSEYYRVVNIPEAYFGIIAAVASICGMLTAGLMQRMLKKYKADLNFISLALIILIGFIGIAFAIPYWGILFVLPFMLGMRFLQFFLSYYINQVTNSARRATALSFKGLAMNLGYGALNICYAFQAKSLIAAGLNREEQLIKAMSVWPWVFAVLLVAYLVIFKFKAGKDLDTLIRENAVS